MMLWRCINVTGLSIEVTKDRSFLYTNFKLVLIVGALIGLHLLFELAIQFGLISTPRIQNTLYYLDISAIMLALLLLAIAWYRLLSKVNRWDKRWIKAEKKSS